MNSQVVAKFREINKDMPQGLKDMLNPRLPQQLYDKMQKIMEFQSTQNDLVIKKMLEIEEKYEQACKLDADLDKQIEKYSKEYENLRNERKAMQQELMARGSTSFNSTLSHSTSFEVVDRDDSNFSLPKSPKNPQEGVFNTPKVNPEPTPGPSNAPDPFKTPKPSLSSSNGPQFSFKKKSDNLNSTAATALRNILPYSQRKTSTPTTSSQYKVLEDFSFRSDTSSIRK